MYSIKKKIFGFIPTQSNQNHHIEKISFAEAEKLIELHFKNDRENILSY
jgi:hypothetical protein